MIHCIEQREQLMELKKTLQAEETANKALQRHLANKGAVAGSCSIVVKPLCFHAREPDLNSYGSQTSRPPNLLALLGQLCLPLFQGR